MSLMLQFGTSESTTMENRKTEFIIEEAYEFYGDL